MTSTSIEALLIEDNPGDARLIYEELTTAPTARFSCRHVDRLSDATELLRGGNIDVILLDLTLPDSDGLSTVSRASELAPDTPIVVLTGIESDAMGVEAIQLGAQDYLGKSAIGHGFLARVVVYALERRRLASQLAAGQRNAARTQMLSEVGLAMAHHVRNALVPLMTAAEMPEFEYDRMREVVLESSIRIAAVVDALLEAASRGDGGEPGMSRADPDLMLSMEPVIEWYMRRRLGDS
jgi:DNA-binding response OmpR family regulator